MMRRSAFDPNPDASNSQPSRQEEEGRIPGRRGGGPLNPLADGARTSLEVPDMEPGVNDVLSGRTRQSYHHAGNKRFREIISNSVHGFSQTKSRGERAMIVSTIFDTIRTRGGRFLKKPDGAVPGDGTPWYVMTDHQAKEKIAHAVRDATTNSHEIKKSQANLYGGGSSIEDKSIATRDSEQQQMKDATISPVPSRGITSSGAAFFDPLATASMSPRQQAPSAFNPLPFTQHDTSAGSIPLPSTRSTYGLDLSTMGDVSFGRRNPPHAQQQYHGQQRHSSAAAGMEQRVRPDALERSSLAAVDPSLGNPLAMPWSAMGSYPVISYSRSAGTAGPMDHASTALSLEAMYSSNANQYLQEPSSLLVQPRQQQQPAASLDSGRVASANQTIIDLSNDDSQDAAAFAEVAAQTRRSLYPTTLQNSSSSTNTDTSFLETINDALGPVQSEEDVEIDKLQQRGGRGHSSPEGTSRQKLRRKREREDDAEPNG